MFLMSRILHVPTVSAAVPQMASVPPHAMARPGVGSGMSLIFLPAISTKELSTMWRAARLSTPSMCLGAAAMSSWALWTLKMVVFSTPLATVPALHLFLPRLTREPIVMELMRYGSPVQTPLTT